MSNVIPFDTKKLVIVQEGADHRQRDVWLHQQTGEAMEPTLRNGDMVAVSRVRAFQYDALYLMSVGFFQGEEHFDLCRCQSMGGQGIRVYHDHHAFKEGSFVTREEFAKLVRGIVVMRCIVDDARALGLA